MNRILKESAGINQIARSWRWMVPDLKPFHPSASILKWLEFCTRVSLPSGTVIMHLHLPIEVLTCGKLEFYEYNPTGSNIKHCYGCIKCELLTIHRVLYDCFSSILFLLCAKLGSATTACSMYINY